MSTDGASPAAAIATEADKPGNAVSFQVFLPSGLVIDLGTSEGSKPRALGGVARAARELHRSPQPGSASIVNG